MSASTSTDPRHFNLLIQNNCNEDLLTQVAFRSKVAVIHQRCSPSFVELLQVSDSNTAMTSSYFCQRRQDEQLHEPTGSGMSPSPPQPETITRQTTITSDDRLFPPDDLLSSIDAGSTQPLLEQYPQTKIGSQNRAFSPSLYKKFQFVEYSVKCDAVFCFNCRHFQSRLSNSDPVFTSLGFRNWKRCHTALAKHSTCESHLQATAYYSSWCNAVATGSVASQVQGHASKLTERNRSVLSTLSRIGIFCGRQGLPLRGHRESHEDPSSNDGNFLSLVELIALESCGFHEKLESLPKNATYISKDSQNAILHASVEVILDTICTEKRVQHVFP